MALKKILTAGSLLAALIIGNSQTVEAQDIHLPGARFEHRKLDHSNNTAPIPQPGVFDYDAQVFAPFELTSNEQVKPRHGFFITYDRTYLSISESPRINDNIAPSPDVSSNFVWGTRYNAGWFSDDDTGWQITFQQNTGLSFTNSEQAISSADPTAVDTAFNSVEINRLFRQSSKHGHALEPYIGLRYFHVSDQTTQDTTQDTTAGRFFQDATNNAIGFQAGARRTRRNGRWKFTLDGAIIGAYNQQRYFASNSTETATTITFAESGSNDQSFIPAVDGEFDISFNISRDITLRTGVQVNYLWSGINRADTTNSGVNPNSTFSGSLGAQSPNDNRFIAAGFIFGFEWRR